MENVVWQAVRELFENPEANTNDMLEYLEKGLWQAVRNLFENAKANTDNMLEVVRDEEPLSHNGGLIYTPINTYRNVESQQWVDKNDNEQMIVDIINHRKGDTVLDGKEGALDAPQTALSVHREHIDYGHTYEDCEKNLYELYHEQKVKRKERMEYLKKRKIPQTEWVFHLDAPKT